MPIAATLAPTTGTGTGYPAGSVAIFDSAINQYRILAPPEKL